MEIGSSYCKDKSRKSANNFTKTTLKHTIMEDMQKFTNFGNTSGYKVHSLYIGNTVSVMKK